MIVDKIPGQVTLWWDQEQNCLMFQVGDRPPVPVSSGEVRIMRFRGPDDEVLGAIKFKVQKGDPSGR